MLQLLSENSSSLRFMNFSPTPNAYSTRVPSSFSFPGRAGTSIPTSIFVPSMTAFSSVVSILSHRDSTGWYLISSSPASSSFLAFSRLMTEVYMWMWWPLPNLSLRRRM